MKTDNNFIPLSTINPFKKIYAYVDTRDYKADNIFYNKNLKVKFLKDFIRNDDNYIIVYISIWNKDIPLFMECMKDLERLMILTGYSKSVDIINDIIKDLEPKKKGKLQCLIERKKK